MNYLEQFTDEQLDTMVLQIEELAQWDESEIYGIMGSALNYEGLAPSPLSQSAALIADVNIANKSGIDLHQRAPILTSGPSKHSSAIGNRKYSILGAQPEAFDLNQAYTFITSPPVPPIPADNTEKGRSFWEGLKDRLKKEICTNEKIVKLMTGEASLREYLREGLPLIAVALGLGTFINPAMLLVIASVFALIIKVGFKTYCDLE